MSTCKIRVLKIEPEKDAESRLGTKRLRDAGLGGGIILLGLLLLSRHFRLQKVWKSSKSVAKFDWPLQVPLS